MIINGKNKLNFIKIMIDNLNENIIFSRYWEMPNSNTFDIKCIKNFILKYDNLFKENYGENYISIDPFANKSRLTKITNDIDPDMKCDYSMDALDFLKTFADNSVDFILFDPPYSTRQVSECYKKLNKTVTMQITQSSFWTKFKKEIARITKVNGIVLSFAWNSNGIGKTNNFKIIEQMNVAHGGFHYDTICVAEIKIK